MEIDNKITTTSMYTIPTNFTTALEDKSTESTVETEVLVD